MNDAPDLELFAACRKGDRRAASILASRHYDGFVAWLSSKVAVQDAHDIAHEVFIALFANASTVELRSTFKALLFGIARWKLVEHFRAKRRANDRFSTLESSVADSSATTISAVITRSRHEALVVRALTMLPFDEQILLELKAVEGFSRDELAEILHLPSSTIPHRIRAARQRLQKTLEGLDAAAPMTLTSDESIVAVFEQIRSKIAAMETDEGRESG